MKTKYRIIEFDSPLIGKYYKIQRRIIGNIWFNMPISQESYIVFSKEEAMKWFTFFTEGYTEVIIKEQ